MSRSPGPTGNASRFTLRACAVGLLVLGVVGGAQLAAHRDQRRDSVEAAAQLEARSAVIDERSQLVEERTETGLARRIAVEEATEVADDEAEEAAGLVSRAEEAASRREAESRIPTRPDVPIPDSCDEYSGNRAIGCALLLEAGFGLDQMPCLDSLWTRESGWNHLASNPYSGAYGIPQAYPGNKMSSAGADWETNPATQITWGLGYIRGRYGDPCGAYAYSQANGSY